MWQEHRTQILNCNRQSYGAAKLIWAHNFKFNWWVLKPSLSHFSVLKSLHYLFFFRFFGGSSYHEKIVSQEPKMVWGSKLYVHVTGHDRQKRALGFPGTTQRIPNKSLQNAFPIFECEMMTNGTPLQDTVHALLLQKLVHRSIFFAWILHETGDGIKHVFTLLVVEIVRGMQLLDKTNCRTYSIKKSYDLIILIYIYIYIRIYIRVYIYILIISKVTSEKASKTRDVEALHWQCQHFIDKLTSTSSDLSILPQPLTHFSAIDADAGCTWRWVWTGGQYPVAKEDHSKSM